MQFDYRGAVQEFSNRYHFHGGTPSDASHWEALFTDIRDRVVGAEQRSLAGAICDRVTIVKWLGYAAGSTIAAHFMDDATAGSRVTTDFQCPGDSAMLLRWATDSRTSKGHPVYLFNYLHGVNHISGDGDTLNSGDVIAAGRYALHWWNAGYTDGVNTYHRAGPNGATAVDQTVSEWVHHRDFPR